MPKVDVYDINSKVVGDIELSENIFSVDVNENAIHQVVVNQLANKDRVLNRLKKVKFAVVVLSHGDRKVQVRQDREVFVRHSGLRWYGPGKAEPVHTS